MLARDLGDSVPQTHRVIVHREQGGAPPRSILQRSRSSVGAGLTREPGDADYQTYRVIVHRGQARSYRRAPKPVGAVLARDWGDSVPQTNRVIVHREQGGAPPRSILQRSRSSVGAGLAREPGDADYQTYRVIVHREQARLLQVYSPVGVVGGYDGDECGVSGKPMFAAFGSSYRLGVRPLGQVGGRHKQKQVGCQAASLWLLIWALG